MTNDKAQKYNEHSKFMADIALAILNGNKEALDVNGVKEIIALYLLIPYITPDILQTPGEDYKIPKISGDFCDNVSLENLRNGICHSFVTIEADNNDGTQHGKYLIFDDRITFNGRKEHSEQGEHSTTTYIPLQYVNEKLLELFDMIRKQ